ncbi:hypothetical protein DSTSK_09070 [Desulforhabdus sp. TSK]|nr:hypothetical protein DSTSK_09070 [Desulforhabdus sp. TSK]
MQKGGSRSNVSGRWQVSCGAADRNGKELESMKILTGMFLQFFVCMLLCLPFSAAVAQDSSPTPP